MGTCDGIIETTGYVPKGCDGAYMHPADRVDYCDELERVGEALPHFCFADRGGRNERRGRRGGRYRDIFSDALDAIGKAIHPLGRKIHKAITGRELKYF